MCELSHGCQAFTALMSVNKGNVTRRNTASVPLQPHLTQQMQNVPAGSHVCANFMLVCVNGLFLASKEKSKSHLHSKGVGWEEHYFCTRKGTVALALLLQKGWELRDCFGCAEHRPGPWLLDSVSVILTANTTLGQLLLAPAAQTGRAIEEICVLPGEGMGWAAEKQGTSLPPPRWICLPPPALRRGLQGHKCLWHKFS